MAEQKKDFDDIKQCPKGVNNCPCSSVRTLGGKRSEFCQVKQCPFSISLEERLREEVMQLDRDFLSGKFSKKQSLYL